MARGRACVAENAARPAEKHSRGQLTLETLLLAAIALSLILVAAAALNKMRGGEQTLLTQRTLLTELQSIGAYSDEICVLGEGNSRVMALAPGGVLNLSLDETDASGRTLLVQAGNWNASIRTLCPQKIEDSNFTAGGSAYLWHDENGETIVHISATPKP